MFPDGELLDIADSLRSMERAGFEIRDVENLREHYAQTLRCWVANLQANWDDAPSRWWGSGGPGCGCSTCPDRSTASTTPALQLHQALGVRNAPDGTSSMPRTRRGWD